VNLTADLLEVNAVTKGIEYTNSKLQFIAKMILRRNGLKNLTKIGRGHIFANVMEKSPQKRGFL